MTTRDDLVSRLNAGCVFQYVGDGSDNQEVDTLATYATMQEAASALEAKDAEIERLQCVLSFWMPGVDLRLDDATRELAAHDAEMLAGYAGQIDRKCWGDEILERALTAESRISDLERQLAEETERCARVAESNMHSSVMPGHVGKNIAAAIRGGAK